MNVGQTVKQGQRIGWMGNTSSSTAQHLHFEIHNGKWATGQPNAIDPLPLITEKAVKPVVIEKPTPKPAPKTRYPDVGTSMRAYNAIENLSKLHIINGYIDGSFKPNAPVTRGEMAILMDRLYKEIKG